MNPFEDDIAAAIEMIAEDGEECLWVKPAAIDPAAKPWRSPVVGIPADHPVSIAFFSPADISRGAGQAAMFVNGTEVVSFSEIGLMAGGQGFEPAVLDTIERNSGKAQVVAIDKVAPNGIAILYYVGIK
jgi:hypothetical protein